MDITKDKVKKAGILTGVVGAVSEYASASFINSFDYIKNYQFNEFWDSIDYNLMHPMANITNALSNEMYTNIQPFLIGGTLFLAGKVLFQKTDRYEDASDYGAYGTARWAKESEIFNREDITTDLNKEGSILGLHKKKYIVHHMDSYLNRNVLLVGGSGGGKTQANIIPNILKNKNKSLVVVDPKGELYEKTSEAKRKEGYEVHLINFKNREKSDRYNLFEYIRKDSDAYKVSSAYIENSQNGEAKADFWNGAQASLLQAFILYVRYKLPKEMHHMGSVYALSQFSPAKIRKLFLAYPKGHIVRKAYIAAMDKLQDKTEADVFVTLNQTLNPWQYQDVCEFTYTNDFLFEDLGKKKIILYIIMPIADNEFRPLISSFFTQMFSELYRLADLNFGELPNNVLLLLDEFANIGKINNFYERLATTRSLGIEVTIVLQDTSQLQRVYGDKVAKEIVNNCDTRILLKANELETAKYFSQLAGKTTIKITNKSSSNGSKSSSKSESVSYTGRDLITPDEVSRLKKKEMLVFIAGQYPLKVEKPWYKKIKAYKHLLSNEVSREDYPTESRLEYRVFSEEDVKQEMKEIRKADKEKKKQEEQQSKQDDYDEEFFVPVKTEDGLKVDTETGEILEQMKEPVFSDNDVPPENDHYAYRDSDIPPEPMKDISVDDLGGNFKF